MFLQYFGSVPSTNRTIYLRFILVLILCQIFVFRVLRLCGGRKPNYYFSVGISYRLGKWKLSVGFYKHRFRISLESDKIRDVFLSQYPAWFFNSRISHFEGFPIFGAKSIGSIIRGWWVSSTRSLYNFFSDPNWAQFRRHILGNWWWNIKLGYNVKNRG